MEDLDQIMADNARLNKTVKSSLENAKSENDKFAKLNKSGSSVVQWRVNQLNTMTRRFKVCHSMFFAFLRNFFIIFFFFVV